LILAATLAASYGIYSGFELCENVAVRPGSEEYLDSEKYRNQGARLEPAGNLNELIARVNEIRHTHPRCSRTPTLTFHGTDTRRPLVQQACRASSTRAAGPIAFSSSSNTECPLDAAWTVEVPDRRARLSRPTVHRRRPARRDGVHVGEAMNYVRLVPRHEWHISL
jgi:hypothetical protein